MSTDQKTDDPQDQRKFKVARECRRHSYERLYNQRTYCSKPEDECIYRSPEKDTTGKYRCMNIEKKDLWRYKTLDTKLKE